MLATLTICEMNIRSCDRCWGH